MSKKKFPDKEDRITVRDHAKEFRTIVKQENRLSKCSKFFRHNNKYYESKYINDFYMGLSSFAYVVEIKDEEKIENLKEKFKLSKKKENDECQQMARDMSETVYDLEVFINAEMQRYKIKNRCNINFSTQEYKNIKPFYNIYKRKLEKVKKENYDRIVFCYLKENNLIGFFICGTNRIHVTFCTIYAINYDVFSDYLKENNILDPGIKEKYKKEDKETIKNLEYKNGYLKSQFITEIEKNVKLQDKLNNLNEYLNTLKEKNQDLIINNSKLEISNKVLRNKYNRFEIMDI